MSTLVLQHMMRREHVWVGSMLSKEDFGDLRATLIQNQRRKRDSKVHTDDSIVACQQDAMDFFDSIGQEETFRQLRSTGISSGLPPSGLC